MLSVPPSGGFLEIGNLKTLLLTNRGRRPSSPFGGIPRNWKHLSQNLDRIQPGSSPFGGIPRNWKLLNNLIVRLFQVLLFPLRGDP